MKSVRRVWVGPVLIVALLAVTVWVVFHDRSPVQLLATLSLVKPKFVALGLLLMVSFICCEALSSWLTLRKLGDAAPYHRCAGYSFTGFVFSSITPSATGGQPAQVVCMVKDGIPAAHGTLAMLLNAVCYHAATLGLALGAMLWRPSLVHALGGGLGFLLGMGTAVVSCLMLGMLALLFTPRPAAALANWALNLGARLHLVRDLERAQARLAEHLEEYRQGAACLRSCPTLLPRLLALAGLQLASLYLVPSVVYTAFGLSGRSVMELAAMQAILTLTVTVLPLPGAVGAAEGAFLQGYRLFFGAELVAPAMLVSRGISFYSFLLISAAAALTFRLFARGAARQEERADKEFKPRDGEEEGL